MRGYFSRDRCGGWISPSPITWNNNCGTVVPPLYNGTIKGILYTDIACLCWRIVLDKFIVGVIIIWNRLCLSPLPTISSHQVCVSHK